MSIVIGIDVGARNTGLVAVDKTVVVAKATVTNDGELLPIPQDYVDAVVKVVRYWQGLYGDVVVGVEGVNRPSWHVQKQAKRGAASNPTALLGTAVLLGAVMGVFPECVVVPPAGNGSGALGAYPDVLVSARERAGVGWELKVGSGGKLRHERSAYDVALKASSIVCNDRGRQ